MRRNTHFCRYIRGVLAILLVVSSGQLYAQNPFVTLEIEQASDLGCDDSMDSPYSTAPLAVAPGDNCIIYRLTATNTGVEDAYRVVVSDLTPAYTTYHKLLGCSVVDCVIDVPQPGTTGRVAGEVPVLPSGNSLQLTFAVKLE